MQPVSKLQGGGELERKGKPCGFRYEQFNNHNKAKYKITKKRGRQTEGNKMQGNK